MTNQKITVGVEIQSNTNKETTQAERLGAALKDAAASAQKIKIPASSATGVQSVMQRSQPVGAQAVMQYGAQRGTAGATGAAARDFAAQSQQLGGLVRIYATYAANVYAAGAAFRALSTAMDTTNMIRGLDQLSASSGKSLGGLSKQFQQVTGGAISMREAVEATVKASSSGLGSSDILRLGTVAQKASVALGVNMSDAVSRLSRGITKLEPELLDELGIFTKIEPAVEKYARTLGKAAGSLTDFERRQAFALAVLAEAEEKFGKIDIDVNPYNKLAASFSNLLQKTLELLNIGLAPIVKVLNSNPAVLATAVGLLGASILKNVIPQLADLKKGLDSIATSRANIAKTKRDEGLAGLLPKIVESRAEIDKRNDEFYKQYESGREKLIKRLQKTGPIDPKALQILESKVPEEITADDAKYIKGKLSRAKADRAAFAEFTTGVKGAIATDQELLKNSEKVNETVNKRRSILTSVGRAQADVDAAYKASVRSNIVSDAARTASTDGLWKSLTKVYTATREAGKDKTFQTTLEGTTATGKKFTQNIKETLPGLSLFQQVGTGAAAGAAALGTAIAGIGRALLRLIPYVGIIIAGFEIIKSIWSTSGKEAEAFSQSTDVLKSALDNVNNTLENISKKKPGQIFTIETVQAQATALNDLSTSFSDVATKADKLSKAQSGLDKGIERVYKAIETVPILGRVFNFVAGESDTRKIAKSISNTLNQSLRLATSGEERNKLLEAYQKAYGIDPETLVDKKKFEAALENLSFDELTNRSKTAAEAQKAFSQQINVSAASLVDLRTSLEQTAKEVDSFIVGLIPTDPFSKLGITLLNNSAKIEKALENPKDGILALQDVVTNFKTLALLPPDVQDQLLAARDNVRQFVTEIDALKGAISKADQDLQSAQQKNDQAAIATLQRRSADLQKDLDKKLRAASQFTQQYTQTLQVGMFDSAMKQFDVASKMAGARGAITAERGALGVLAQAGVGTAESEARLAKQEFAIQRSLITAQTELAISVEKLRAETALSNSINELQNKINQNILASQDPRDTQEAKDIRAEEIKRLGLAVNSARDVAQLFRSGSAESIKGLKQIQQTGTAEQKAALGSMSGLVAAIAGRDMQLKEIGGAERAREVEDKSKALTQAREIPARAIQRGTEETQRDLESVRTQEQLSGIYNEQLATKRRGLEAQLLINNYAETELKIDTEIQRINLALASYNFSDEQKKKANAMIRELNIKRELNLEKLISDQTRQRIAAVSEQIAADRELFQERQRQAGVLNEQEIARRNLELERQESEFQRLSANEQLVKSVLISERARIDGLKSQLEYDNQIFDINQKQNQLDQQTKELREKKAAGADVSEAESRLQFDKIALDTQRRLAREGLFNRNGAIKQTQDLAVEQERYNKLLENANTAGESLQNIFSGMGDAAARIGAGLGDMTKAIIGFAVASEQGAKALADIAKNRDDPLKTAEQRAKFAEQYNEQIKKNTKDELTGTAQIVGSAKKMFKEKSAGYKVLGAVEKALHIARLAMDAKELAGKLANVATEMAVKIESAMGWLMFKMGVITQETTMENMGFMQRMGVYVSSIFAKVTSQLGIFGPAVAVALIAALGLRGGRGAGSFKPNIDQQIETQGTGTEYDKRGRKVSTAGGVFGDDSAKADSVRNALDVIRENSTESLLYDNKALAALEKMVMALDKTATSLYSIPGFVLSKDEATTSSKIGVGSTGLFTKEEVLGSTIKFSGSLDDLAAGVESTVNRIDRVNQQNTVRLFGMKLGSFGGQQDRQGTLSEEVRNNLQDVFTYGKELLQTVGEDVGRKVDTSALMATQSLTIKPGMTGEELQAEFTAVVSKQFNIWNEQAFPEFKKFRQFGEEYLETVVRVSATNKSANESIKNLGTATQRFGDLTYEASEALAKSFGGTQEFIAAFEAYGQSMFTEQEQLDRKRISVAERLNKLGLRDIKTKTQYNAKVQQLIQDGQQNTETFKKLILLAPEFAEVVESVADRLENAQSALESAYSDLDSAGEVFRNIIKSLKDFKDSLQKTITTPGEQYIKAKARFEQLAIEAKTSPKAAQELANAGQIFAEASRTMFASSQAYVDDVGFINRAVDEVLVINQNLLTPIEEQLIVAREQNIRLAEISGYTYTTKERINALITALQAAIPEVAAAKVAAEEVLPPPVKLSIQEKPEPTPGSYSDITSKYTATPTNIIDAFLGDLFGYASSGSIPTGTASSIYDLGGANAYFETGATGSNYIKKDMPLFVHEGERLMPAADNRQLMKMVSDYSGGGNSELYDEVCRLTRQVEVLTQVVADGAILNAQATDRNTEQIADVIQNTSESTVYNQRLQNRTAVV
jgi:hypothetical protein